MFKNKDTRSALSGSALPAAGASQFAGGVRTAGAVLPAGNARTTGVKPAAMRSGNRGAGQNFGGALGGAPLGGVPAAGLQGAPQHSGGVFAEMVCSWLEKVRFRKKLFGGVDERDVWLKINELNELYERGLAAERARYDALLGAGVRPPVRPVQPQPQHQSQQAQASAAPGMRQAFKAAAPGLRQTREAAAPAPAPQLGFRMPPDRKYRP